MFQFLIQETVRSTAREQPGLFVSCFIFVEFVVRFDSFSGNKSEDNSGRKIISPPQS